MVEDAPACTQSRAAGTRLCRLYPDMTNRDPSLGFLGT